MDAAEVFRWSAQFNEVLTEVGRHFSRSDLRGRAKGYVRGLLGPVDRKNAWQLAEYVGDATPDAIQRLLGPAKWDADAVRDEVRRYACEHLLGQDEGGVLIVDETGFLKKGRKSVGVQRQYSGTAGRIENCQVGVFLAIRGSRGRCLIDREIYLPQVWCQDPERRREAHVPEDVTFATKPQLAMRMIERALDAGVEPEWVLGDEVYSEFRIRRMLEDRGRPYILAVPSSQRLWVDCQQVAVKQIADEVAAEHWWPWSVAEGSKGPRVYEWAAAKLGVPTETGLVRWLLVRRPPGSEDPAERAYYLCAAPPRATARDLATGAGQRWAIESCFETGKQETGLDEYEVRTWHGWYRHITLSMLALAFLAAVRAEVSIPSPAKRGSILWCR